MQAKGSQHGAVELWAYLSDRLILSPSEWSLLEFVCWAQPLFHAWKHLWTPRFMKLSDITCDSGSISAMSSDLHPFHRTSTYGNSRPQGATKEVCLVFGVILLVVAHKVGFISGNHSADGAQILQQSPAYLNLWLQYLSMCHMMALECYKHC